MSEEELTRKKNQLTNVGVLIHISDNINLLIEICSYLSVKELVILALSSKDMKNLIVPILNSRDDPKPYFFDAWVYHVLKCERSGGFAYERVFNDQLSRDKEFEEMKKQGYDLRKAQEVRLRYDSKLEALEKKQWQLSFNSSEQHILHSHGDYYRQRLNCVLKKIRDNYTFFQGKKKQDIVLNFHSLIGRVSASEYFNKGSGDAVIESFVKENLPKGK